MRRSLALLEYALGSLARHRLRTISLGVSIAFTTALFASALMLVEALAHEFRENVAAAPDLTVQSLVAGRPALVDVGLAARIAELPAVERVTPRVWGYHFVTSLGANVTVVGLPREALAGNGASEFTPVSGRLPRVLGGRDDGEAVLGEGLARGLGARIGDDVYLKAPSGEARFVRVVGTFRPESQLTSTDLLLTTDDVARALLGVPAGRATDLAVTLTTPDESEVLTQALIALVPNARVVDKRLVARTYALSFSARGALLFAALLSVLATMLLVAWDRLTGHTAGQAREIAILKTLGWETSDVLLERLFEALVLSTSAAITGVLCAYVYIFVLGAPGIAPIVFGWSTLYPKLALAPTIDPSVLAAVASVVVAPFVAVGVVPAWRTAMTDPDALLRGGGEP